MSEQDLWNSVSDLLEQAENSIYDYHETNAGPCVTLKQQPDYETAIQHCNAALELGGTKKNDDYPLDVWTILAKCYFEVQRYEDACTVFSQVLTELQDQQKTTQRSQSPTQQVIEERKQLKQEIVSRRYDYARALSECFSYSDADRMRQAIDLNCVNLIENTDDWLNYRISIALGYDQYRLARLLDDVVQSKKHLYEAAHITNKIVRKLELQPDDAVIVELLLEARNNLAMIAHRQGQYLTAQKQFLKIAAVLLNEKNGTTFHKQYMRNARRCLAAYFGMRDHTLTEHMLDTIQAHVIGKVKHTSADVKTSADGAAAASPAPHADGVTLPGTRPSRSRLPVREIKKTLTRDGPAHAQNDSTSRTLHVPQIKLPVLAPMDQNKDELRRSRSVTATGKHDQKNSIRRASADMTKSSQHNAGDVVIDAAHSDQPPVVPDAMEPIIVTRDRDNRRSQHLMPGTWPAATQTEPTSNGQQSNIGRRRSVKSTIQCDLVAPSATVSATELDLFCEMETSLAKRTSYTGIDEPDNRSSRLESKRISSMNPIVWFKRLRRITHQDFMQYHDPRRAQVDRVRVAVLDTGLDMTRLDIEKDNVKRQFVDYKDFVHGSDECHDNDTSNKHGTNCASLLARVAPNADIYIANVVPEDDPGGPTPEALCAALKYATDVWNVDVISISSGFIHRPAQLEDMIDEVKAKKKLVIVAAPNRQYDGPDYSVYPAFSTSVLTIGAWTRTQWGSGDAHYFATHPIVFPGEEVVILDRHHKKIDVGEPLDGTSYAAPLAAGTVALILDLAFHQKQHRRGSPLYRMLVNPQFLPAVLKNMSDLVLQAQASYLVKPWKKLGGLDIDDSLLKPDKEFEGANPNRMDLALINILLVLQDALQVRS